MNINKKLNDYNNKRLIYESNNFNKFPFIDKNVNSYMTDYQNSNDNYGDDKAQYASSNYLTNLKKNKKIIILNNMKKNKKIRENIFLQTENVIKKWNDKIEILIIWIISIKNSIFYCWIYIK